MTPELLQAFFAAVDSTGWTGRFTPPEREELTASVARSEGIPLRYRDQFQRALDDKAIGASLAKLIGAVEMRGLESMRRRWRPTPPPVLARGERVTLFNDLSFFGQSPAATEGITLLTYTQLTDSSRQMA
ncbi:MAG: hypothetical protein Q7T11_01610, partial [Deltaproteobacteria bacterium]|nr:hypothetical protein [Deltaproteobacteria bacterium]